MKTFKFYLFATTALAINIINAATIQISLSTSGVFLKNIAGVNLDSGGAVDGDGTILQLGYYSSSTVANPFAGSWIPITGPGTTYQTTIGDSGNRGDGSLKLLFEMTQGSLSFTEPSVGTPLSLRFYDGTTIANSGFFNAVSNTEGGFNWAAPAVPNSTAILNLTLITTGDVWQDGPGSSYRTTIAIPEPSCGIILTLVTGLVVTRRRRIKSFA